VEGLASPIGSEGEQGEVAGTLDRLGEDALVPSARSGLPARANLPDLRDEAAQHIHLLVVDGLRLIGAKLADPGPPNEPPTPTARLFAATRFHFFDLAVFRQGNLL